MTKQNPHPHGAFMLTLGKHAKENEVNMQVLINTKEKQDVQTRKFLGLTPK